MARNLIIFGLAAMIAGTSADAFAQPLRCGERAQIVQLLSEVFKERQRGFGLIGNQTLIELFLAPSGSWTILSTGRSGVTCIVASGHAWQEIPRGLGQEVNVNFGLA